MDEQLRTRLIEYLDTLDAGIKSASDQMPGVIQEWLNWIFWSSVAWGAFLFVLLVFGTFVVRWFWRTASEMSTSDKDLARAISGTMYALLFLGCTLGGAKQVHTCIKVVAAPRVVAIETIKDLMEFKK